MRFTVICVQACASEKSRIMCPSDKFNIIEIKLKILNEIVLVAYKCTLNITSQVNVQIPFKGKNCSHRLERKGTMYPNWKFPDLRTYLPVRSINPKKKKVLALYMIKLSF